MLVTAGADINRANDFDNTALILAAREGRVEIAETLIATGADINRTNIFWDTALAYATEYGHADIAQMLINARERAQIPDTAPHEAVLAEVRVVQMSAGFPRQHDTNIT
eukprot:GEMP01112619.1.p1 GENE.GEMP01112619.1~~GEMP01112619.1.p1  ORF type:complete len:109 (+),score=25.30 GEMP01112619.1:2-328(+)